MGIEERGQSREENFSRIIAADCSNVPNQSSRGSRVHRRADPFTEMLSTIEISLMDSMEVQQEKY